MNLVWCILLRCVDNNDLYLFVYVISGRYIIKNEAHIIIAKIKGEDRDKFVFRAKLCNLEQRPIGPYRGNQKTKGGRKTRGSHYIPDFVLPKICCRYR